MYLLIRISAKSLVPAIPLSMGREGSLPIKQPSASGMAKISRMYFMTKKEPGLYANTSVITKYPIQSTRFTYIIKAIQVFFDWHLVPGFRNLHRRCLWQ